jgi:hypothetical protein
LEEEEVAQVVRAKLYLEAIFGPPFRRGYNARVKDKQIKLIALLVEGLSSCSHRGEGIQPQLYTVDGCIRFRTGSVLDFIDGLLGLDGVSGSEVESGTGGVESSRYFDTDTRVCARHKGDLAGELADEAFILNDLKSRGPRISRTLRVSVGGGVSRHCDGFLMESGLCSKRMGWCCCGGLMIRDYQFERRSKSFYTSSVCELPQSGSTKCRIYKLKLTHAWNRKPRSA